MNITNMISQYEDNQLDHYLAKQHENDSIYEALEDMQTNEEITMFLESRNFSPEQIQQYLFED